MLFSEYKIKDLSLKNRIVMSPMSMYASEDGSGEVNNWHRIHYPSRAIGEVGLIILESTAINLQGRQSPGDLGIWDNKHIKGLSQLVSMVKEQGAAVGIQLNHAGRKAKIDGPIVAPSSIPLNKDAKIPEELSKSEIMKILNDYRAGAARAKQAGFDVLEIHAAHGYLIHEFLSPITNQRNDEYGGSVENRYLFLRKVVEIVKEVWGGPLFVRVSATEYDENGSTIDDYIQYAKWLKTDGVDLIDVSAGGLVDLRPEVYPGYQVPLAEKIRNGANVATGAVGKIIQPEQAEEIIANKRSELVFIGRELLWNPNWVYYAAERLGYNLKLPKQFSWSWISKL